MGWLYMKSLRGHESPAHYLDDQFTYQCESLHSRVLKSALVTDVYYAAVEHLDDGGAREVFAVVCLIDFNPSAPDGFIFGYKDMTERMGPYAYDCPVAILDLLTPTDRAYALEWRARCRANAARAAAA
jgi:hypothetical protein